MAQVPVTWIVASCQFYQKRDLCDHEMKSIPYYVSSHSYLQVSRKGRSKYFDSIFSDARIFWEILIDHDPNYSLTWLYLSGKSIF